jgi:hypothetical protein
MGGGGGWDGVVGRVAVNHAAIPVQAAGRPRCDVRLTGSVIGIQRLCKVEYSFPRRENDLQNCHG